MARHRAPLRRAVFLVAALAIPPGGCSSPAEDSTAAPIGGSRPAAKPIPLILYTAVVGDPQSFNPITAEDDSSRAPLGWIFDTLIRLDPRTTEVEPNLAKSWRCSADGLECVFQPRSDGSPSH